MLTGKRQKALDYARDHRGAFLAKLEELLRIPSVSTDPAHAADVRRAADWVEAYLREIGLEQVTRLETPGYPMHYGEWLGAGPDAPTVLLYGHYDVQPVDPLDEWISPPFEPTPRGEDLYARGISDDKSQFFAALAAVESYLATSGSLPVNFKVLLEGEEEISSPYVTACVQRYRDRLAADAVVICDQPMVGPMLPAILYGVRGCVYMEIELKGAERDYHSGMVGGAVANPLTILTRLLGSCAADDGRIAVAGFYDSVRPLSETERSLLAKSPVTDEMIRRVTGVPAVAAEPGFSAAESMCVRPTFEVHGIVGGYAGPGKKSVIPCKALAKIGCRLVPDQHPDEIARLFESHLRARTPPTVRLEFRVQATSLPAVVNHEDPAVKTAERAYRLAFGVEPIYMRGGGSLPIVRDFLDVLKTPVVLIGFGLPDDNMHAPNEKMHLPNLWRGIDTIIHYLAEYPGARA